MSVVVFPHIATAIRRRRGGIYAVLAQHVAPVGQPRVVGPEPLGHGGRGAPGSNDPQGGGGGESVFMSFLFRVDATTDLHRIGETPPSAFLTGVIWNLMGP